MRKHCSLVHVRFNTESDGKSLLWRLILDGEEVLVNSIRIEKGCFTSTDWLEDKQCFKHHISVADANVEIDDTTLNAIIR